MKTKPMTKSELNTLLAKSRAAADKKLKGTRCFSLGCTKKFKSQIRSWIVARVFARDASEAAKLFEKKYGKSRNFDMSQDSEIGSLIIAQRSSHGFKVGVVFELLGLTPADF